MTHARPIPEASIPPWPAHPAPRAHDEAPVVEEARAVKAALPEKGWSRTRVAAGIGSAAIVAALLYSNWSRTNGKRR